MSERQLFAFWLFNGNNREAFCNNRCTYCYGKAKQQKHLWNGEVKKWEQAFERLNRDMYFVMSYGETLGAKGFYDCVDMIGEHPTWTLSIVTNNTYNPSRLLQSRLAKEKRVFINACWHPFGVVEGREKGWETFKKHCLMYKDAGIPLHVLYLWYQPQIKYFPEYFEWLDAHDIRVTPRRYLGYIGGYDIPFTHWHIGGKRFPRDYTEAERGFLYASVCPKVQKYGLVPVSPKGKLCTAGKDLILVKHDGSVRLCADCENLDTGLGNIFDPNFRLNTELVKCPSCVCGGDYGMLHLLDEDFGELPKKLWRDTFVSQVEGLKQESPVNYPNRAEMLKWLKKL